LLLCQSAWVAAAYIFGSIPFGYLVVRLWKGVDVRTVGSGNIGATNVYRAAGVIPGVLVLLLDIGKGYLPLLFARNCSPAPVSSMFLFVVGIAAVVGHSYTIFLKGKGGKGVATSFGVMIGLFPIAALLTFAVWLAVLAAFRYVSLASITAAAALPFLIYFAQSRDLFLTGLGVLVFILILYRHGENIKRLAAGKENRFVAPWKKRQA